MTEPRMRSLTLGLSVMLLIAAGCGGGGGANGSDPDVALDLIVMQTLPTNRQEVANDLGDPGLEGVIRVFFSEQLMRASVIDDTNTYNHLTSDVNILDSGMERVEGLSLLSPDRMSLVFTPAGDLPNGQYTITVTRDVMNFQGGRLNNGQSDHRSSFTAGTDIYAPVIRNTFPAPNQKDIAKDSQVIITFNESLNPATVSNTTVTVVDGSANPPVPVNGTLTVIHEEFEAVFTPDPASPMPPNATIVVTVTGGSGGVTDAIGNPFEGDPATPGTYQFQFETVKEPPPPNNPIAIDVINFDALLVYGDQSSIGTLQEGPFLTNTLDFTLWGTGNPIPNGRTRIGQPGEIIFDPRFGPTDGHTWLYIIDKASRSVTIVGTRDSKIVWRWKDLPDPAGLAISPNALTMYVSNYSNDTVSFIDSGSLTVGVPLATQRTKDASKLQNRTDVQVGRGPMGAANAPDANILFVGNALDNTCSVISTSSATVSTTFAIGTRPQDVAATFNFPGIGRFAYITCLGGGTDDKGSVSLYWNRPNGLQATVTGFENPKGCIYDRGATAWIANSGGTTTQALTLTIQGGGFAATILPTITATVNVGKNATGVTMESFYPYFGAATRTIITACRGSGELVFLDNAQPSRPTFAITIPGVHEIASYYDQ